jgi:hypothetical protein
MHHVESRLYRVLSADLAEDGHGCRVNIDQVDAWLAVGALVVWLDALIEHDGQELLVTLGV